MSAVASTAIIAQEHWEDLADMLRDELQEYGEFLALLDEQQKAILAQDADALHALETAIQQQIQATQEIRDRRTDMVVTFAELAGMSANTSLRELLPFFPDAAQPMMMALINEINTLIGKTRKALRQNNLLLTRATEVTEKLLAALNPTASTRTYARSGSVSVKSSRVGSCIRTTA